MGFKSQILNLLPNQIKQKLIGTDARTKNIAQNAALSLLMKSSNILCSLLIVPMTIDYINPSRYGIWLTISSIVGWILFFDLGLGNGFRNHFVKARAENNVELCRKYVSTTYCAIAVVVAIIWVLAMILNNFLDWSSILKVSESYRSELHNVVIIVISFSSLNMIVNLFATLLTADLRPGFASVINAIGQWLVLIGIFILKKTTEDNLEILALVFAGTPSITMLLVSFALFAFSRYKIYRPSIRLFEITLLRNIMGLGVKFFIIYLCMIASFQIINVVITREIGPLGVTQYTIANKYFSIVYMVVTIIITPIWSAVTDAYSRKDILWLKNLNNNMLKLLFSSILANLIFLILSPFAYKIWIGNSVNITIGLSAMMAIYVCCQTFSVIYVGIINGIGTITLQLMIFILFALLAWPMFTFFAKTFGLIGIVIIPSMIYLTQGLTAYIQFSKILNDKAKGIWRR